MASIVVAPGRAQAWRLSPSGGPTPAKAMQSLTLIVLVVVSVLLGAAISLWLTRRSRAEALPREWHLTLRPVFSSDERRMYRQLREAFPEHAILVKLPLTRFTQPSETDRAGYWYKLIGNLHVTFAISNLNGRVIAAIDIEGARGGSRRGTAIKTGVLNACRVRYLCFMVDDLPSLLEVQRLVLHDGPQPMPLARSAISAPTPLDDARSTLARTVRQRREQRSALWQDSTFAQDSFFAPDSRLDGMIESGFASLPPAEPTRDHHDIGGVVVDEPTPSISPGR